MYVRTVAWVNDGSGLAWEAWGDSLPMRLGKGPDENAAGCAWASAGRKPGECYEEGYVYRGLNTDIAELGLWRGNFGKQLTVIVLVGRRNAVGHLGSGYAGVDVDWPGKHAAICRYGPSFRQHHERREQFRYVELVGCKRGVDQWRRIGQRRRGRHGDDWGGFGNSSRIGYAFGNGGGGESAVHHNRTGGLVDTGQHQPAVYGDRRLQRRQQC